MSPDILHLSLEGEQERVEAYTAWCRRYFFSENTRFTVQVVDRLVNYSDFLIRD
jgi:hypothetical protein